MKIKLSILFIVVIAFGCKKSVEHSISKEQELGQPNTPKANKDTDRGILKGYSFFEVDAPNAVRTIAQIANSSYTQPYSAYGFAPSIDFRLDNNNIDIVLVNSSINALQVSLNKKAVTKIFNVPPSLQLENGKRFLGFESIGNGMLVLGHSPSPDPTDDLIHDAYYSCFNGNSGEIKYTTKLWSDPSISYSSFVGRKASPGQASTPVLKYNKFNDVLGIYFSHLGETGHQGGFMAFIKASTGEVMTKINNGKKTLIGNEWFYSHNFDNRLLVCNFGSHPFYSLAHGDTYPRALGLNKWSEVSGLLPGELNYLKDMSGSGNTTDSRTGDLLELPNGDLAILYSTKVGRQSRDAKIIIVSGLNTDRPFIKKETWLTANDTASGEFVGWGMQLGRYGDSEILACWNSFNDKTPLKTSFALIDFDGNITSKTEHIPTALLYHGQSMAKTIDNKLVFVSSGANPSKIKINMIEKK